MPSFNGVGIAAVAMLSTVGMTMAIEFVSTDRSPTTPAAIAEMAGLGEKNTQDHRFARRIGQYNRRHLARGFAIGAAALAALTIISAYIAEVGHRIDGFALQISDPNVLIGMFHRWRVPVPGRLVSR